MKFEKNNKIVKKNVKKQKKTEKSKNIILNKIENYENMIQNTIIYTHNYKSMDIINSNELHICLNNCEKIFSELTKIKYELDHNEEIEVILNKLQRINNDVSNLFRPCKSP